MYSEMSESVIVPGNGGPAMLIASHNACCCAICLMTCCAAACTCAGVESAANTTVTVLLQPFLEITIGAPGMIGGCGMVMMPGGYVITLGNVPGAQ